MFRSASFVRLTLACMALFIGGCMTMTPDARLCRAYPEKTEEKTAAEFLLGNLPPSDRDTLSTKDLRENIDYAFAARSETAWGASVPFDIFLHYVLPHRLINEPFSPWRKQFHDELMPLVKESRSLWEAAVRVNLWCAGQVEYRPSSSWLVAPVDLLKVGFGRCEELTILFAAAARSVGIPVRGCWVPAWRHTDDNHVWAEVWDNGEWMPLEAASSVVDPNDNWFLGPARAAPAVYSPVYGNPHRPDAPIYRRGNGYTTLNLTGRYAETAEFTVSCVDANKQPATEQNVALWTFNHGLPQLVARGVTDTTGAARFLLGKGSYIASTGDGVRATATLAEEGTPTRLDLRRPLPKDWSWALNHPTEGAPLDRYPPPDATRKQKLQALASGAKAKRKADRANALHTAQVTFADVPETPANLIESMERCWPSAPRLASEYTTLARQERARLTSLLLEMDPKDLALTHVTELAEDFGGRVSQPSHETLREQYSQDVAAPRLHQEPLSLWGREIATLAASLRKGSTGEIAGRVIHHLRRTPSMERTPFTCLRTVVQSIHAKSGLTKDDKAVLGTAILRSLGIPARMNDPNEGIHFLDRGQWRFLHLDGALPVTRPTPRLKREPAGGRLVLLDREGFFHTVQPAEKEEVTYMRQGQLMTVEIRDVSPAPPTGFFVLY